MTIQLNTTNVFGVILIMLAVTGCIVVLIGAWDFAFGAERSSGSSINQAKIEFIGTSNWLTEVEECVDLYHETEQNETLYYGCMNKLDKEAEK